MTSSSSSSAIYPVNLLPRKTQTETSTPSARNSTPTYITACAKTTRRRKDDYHATLTALNSKGRFPRKSLGQHYVLDSKIHDQLVAAADVGQGDVVAIEKEVANIPFNISTDVVKQLLPMGDIFSEVALLLQEETSSAWWNHLCGHLSSGLSMSSSISIQVDAAVVKFKLKQPAQYPPVSPTKSFFSMVNSAFNGKRKMLRRSLQHICTPLEIENVLETVGRPTTSRPEELTTDDFVKLHNLIVKV